MEGRYPPGVLVQLTDCSDPAKEAEFNQWYDKAFMPECEALGFIRHARRYENLFNANTFEGRPKYLMLAEVYHDNLKLALEEYRRFFDELKAKGRGFDDIAVKLDTIYQKIGREYRSERSGRPIKAVYCGLASCTDTTREDEFLKWADEVHSPEAVTIGPFDTGYRYKVVDANDPVPHQTRPYFTLYETSMDYLKVKDALPAYRKHSQSDLVWLNLLSVDYAAMFSPYK